jgi:thiol-disulfide isomerase/thioredoxin
MKFVKLNICLYVLSFICLSISTKAQNNNNTADSAWQNMPQASFNDKDIKFCYIDSPTVTQWEECGKAKDSQICYYEKFNQFFWKWGVGFWKKFPHDVRRFKWLLQAVYPFYFKNVEKGSHDLNQKLYSSPIDVNERYIWQNQYNKFKAEFMSSSQTTIVDRQHLVFKELMDEIYKGRWLSIRKRKEFDYNDWVKRAIKYAHFWYNDLDDSDWQKKASLTLNGHDFLQENFIIQPFVAAAKLGLSLNDQKKFLKLFLNSGILKLQEQAQIELTNLELYAHPFSFQAISVDGKGIDFNKLNKLVLFDFWDIHCESCIQLMPFINEVYSKYKNLGFEVISVCAIESDTEDDRQKEKKKAIEIYKKLKTDWPLILIEQDQWKPLYKTYGFTSLANVLLFNKKGKLIMYNDELLDHNDIQSIIEKNIK